eukprot:scaffold3759_cov425-Prasinococcus_capsulatus_cf.AAC.5
MGDDKSRRITVLKLVAISFASVAGGTPPSTSPYGFEDVVGAGGSTATILGMLLAPVFWSLPLALMTAELSCMMPENGGHILWVDRAFGPFWSYQNGYWSLLSFVFEGALFPVLFMDYLSSATGWELDSSMRVAIGLGRQRACLRGQAWFS